MQKLGQIDALGRERSPLTESERKRLSERKNALEREQGYQQLIQLCYLGEYNAAKHLVQRYPSWGYEIVDGDVVESQES